MNGSEILGNAATILDLLGYRSLHQPEQPGYTFLVDGETQAIELTYEVLAQKARAIAALLQSFCSQGDRVLLLYQPSLDYICAFFGCLYAGAIAVPAYPPRPNRSLNRIQSIITDAEAKVALTSSSIFANLERRLAQVPQLKTLKWLATENLPTHLGSQWHYPHIQEDTIAFLQYTSGSTAEPKGVMITHANLMHNLSWIYRRFEHSPQSKGVIWLPPYHDMGLIGGVLQPLYGGFPVILMSPLIFLQSPIRWLQGISRYRATISGGPNFAYNLACRKVTPEQLSTLDLSSWDVAFNGAEPINYETLEQFATTFASCGFRREAFYPCYGMAEGTLMVSGGSKQNLFTAKNFQGAELEQNRVILVDNDHTKSRWLVGCGQSLSDQKIVIVNPHTLSPCGPSEVGEIWVWGPSIAKGYWHQSEQNQQTFCAYLPNTGEGPFLRTGDLGFLLDGELFVTGRLKDMIIINGHNHYPQDLERTVEKHHYLIRPHSTAGFSVEIEGEEHLVILAEVERAYLQRHRQKTSPPKSSQQQDCLDTKQLSRSIRQTIAKHYDLQVHTALLLKPGSLPKTSSGKIQRHLCRSNFLAGTLEGIVDS